LKPNYRSQHHPIPIPNLILTYSQIHPTINHLSPQTHCQ